MFAIRGLGVDSKHGLLVKMNFMLGLEPECIYRGRTKLEPAEVRSLYGEHCRISPEYRNAHVKPLNDQFSLAEACLLADTVQGLIDHGIPFDPAAVGIEMPTQSGSLTRS